MIDLTYFVVGDERFPCTVLLGARPLGRGRVARQDVVAEELSLYARVELIPLYECDLVRLVEAIERGEGSDLRSRREFSLVVRDFPPGLVPMLARSRSITELRFLDGWGVKGFLAEPLRFEHLCSLSFFSHEGVVDGRSPDLLPKFPNLRHVDFSPGKAGPPFIDAALSWESLEEVKLLSLDAADLWPWMDRLAKRPELSLFVTEPSECEHPTESARFVNELSRGWNGRRLRIRTCYRTIVRRTGRGLSDYGHPKIPRSTHLINAHVS